MTSKAQVTWVGPGLRLLGEAGGPAMVIDHAMPDEEREDTGPQPMQLLLIGLCGCTGMDVISILKKKRQPFTGLQVRATVERAEEHPKVYTEIHLEFVVTGEEVLTGILTERDLLQKVAGLGLDLGQCQVKDYMSAAPESGRPEHPLAYALQRMIVSDIRYLPLVDEAGIPTGIVSSRDVIAYMAARFSDQAG